MKSWIVGRRSVGRRLAFAVMFLRSWRWDCGEHGAVLRGPHRLLKPMPYPDAGRPIGVEEARSAKTAEGELDRPGTDRGLEPAEPYADGRFRRLFRERDGHGWRL